MTADIIYYRAAETPATLASKEWSLIEDITEGDPEVTYQKGSITFATVGTKSVYVELADQYMNRSIVYNATTVYVTAPPINAFLEVTGSTGSEYYTGMEIDSLGRFNATNLININIYAEPSTDGMPLYYTLTSTGNALQAASNVDPNYVAFDPLNQNLTARLNGDLIGEDADKSVQVIFRDEAGNTTTLSTSIRFNTKLFRFKYGSEYLRNLKEPTSDYSVQLTERNNGVNVDIPSSVTVQNSYMRKWDDIYYPLTHKYPTLSNGQIDTVAALAIAPLNPLYDPISQEDNAVVYDDEGRVTTVNWTSDGTKDYGNFESSPSTDLRYWVIDNEGYGAISLQFEHFNIDSNKYGPPYNKQSPYGGDCVVIYDASAAGCVSTSMESGSIVYTLDRTDLLVELQAYSGIGDKVYNLRTGASVNAYTTGAFTVPEITTTSRVCIILYSDASVTASGFKIKAGPRHAITWNNYDLDYENGELWLHKYPTGAATENQVRAIVDYFDTKATVDYEDGSVIFEAQPSGVVTADYSYYNYAKTDIPNSRLFATYDDDFVDYLEANAYVSPDGVIPNKNIIYNYDLPTFTVVNPSGKLVQLYAWDKDRGLLEFAHPSGIIPDEILPSGISEEQREYSFVPRGRMFADYNHHTFYRLSNDGYGNFVFYDETLVADETPQYPDFTYGDIKIVNEGDVLLEDGLLRFLARGFDSDGNDVVEQVIDINRPWDTQLGSAAETYQKCSVQILPHHTWAAACTRENAKTIMNNGFAVSFQDLYPQQTIFGRVVWVLGGTSGSAYPPATTAGKKAWSSEISGKFYNFTT